MSNVRVATAVVPFPAAPLFVRVTVRWLVAAPVMSAPGMYSTAVTVPANSAVPMIVVRSFPAVPTGCT